jgi:hypothetical protein
VLQDREVLGAEQLPDLAVVHRGEAEGDLGEDPLTHAMQANTMPFDL